jgi:hypothetical protein
MAGDGTPAGTGSRFGNAVVILAGVAALSATLLTCVLVYQGIILCVYANVVKSTAQYGCKRKLTRKGSLVVKLTGW